MAELFQRDKSVISRHIQNVFKEGELQKQGVIAKFATTATTGKTYRSNGNRKALRRQDATPETERKYLYEAWYDV
jgi:hypothetical protein